MQEHRGRQFAQDYAALTAEQRERLGDATIATGDTPRMVYFALGTPIYAFRSPDGGIWVYWGQVQEQDRASDPMTLRFASRSEPALPGPAGERDEVRVRFRHGVVTDWSVGPIDREAGSGFRRLRMGVFPRVP